MKLTVSANQLADNVPTFMRRAGYVYIRDRHSGRESYARRLGGGHYPRFHCYIFEQGGQVTFNLHLDQRQTRYEGVTAHAGEYDGELVQAELDRLQATIDRSATGSGSASPSAESFEDITKGKEQPKKSWWPF